MLSTEDKINLLIDLARDLLQVTDENEGRPESPFEEEDLGALEAIAHWVKI